jgi:hypothetical protein
MASPEEKAGLLGTHSIRYNEVLGTSRPPEGGLRTCTSDSLLELFLPNDCALGKFVLKTAASKRPRTDHESLSPLCETDI